jgi:hypothetical protein
MNPLSPVDSLRGFHASQQATLAAVFATKIPSRSLVP